MPGGSAHVDIFYSCPAPDTTAPAPPPLLHWGMYRASSAQWYHPKEAVPPGSTLDKATRGMRSPMTWQEDTQEWRTSLDLPAKLLPLHLAAVVFLPGSKAYEVPARARYLSVPVGMSAGAPEPMGAEGGRGG